MKCVCGGNLEYSPKYKTLFCNICGIKEGFYSAVSRNVLDVDIIKVSELLKDEDILR